MRTKEHRSSGPPSSRSRHHHASHQHLICTNAAVRGGPATVDAIVVPTARGTGRLRTAIDLSARLGCTLVALCSKWSAAARVDQLGEEAGIRPLAFDLARLPGDLLPRFDTTALLATAGFARNTDTSLKRNIGLFFADLFGWQRIVFLDDDILVPEPDDLARAARLLDNYSSVGLSIDGCPDNSVVCHAYREVGGPQDTFIGGGALAVRPDSAGAFFPDIYNEDWFFLLEETGLRRSAMSGRVIQWPYNPYADARRARSEEFGDCLAEGIFALLDNGWQIPDANTAYWRHFLRKRRRFIDEIIGQVPVINKEPQEEVRIIRALEAARGQSQLMTAELCVAYLRAWQSDRERWRRHVQGLRREHLLETLLVPPRPVA